MRKLSLCIAAVALLSLGACGSKSSAIADAQAAPAPQATAATSTVTLSQADLDQRINAAVEARLASSAGTTADLPQAQPAAAPVKVAMVTPKTAKRVVGRSPDEIDSAIVRSDTATDQEKTAAAARIAERMADAE